MTDRVPPHVFASVVVAGTVTGHVLAYGLTLPGAGARAGHAYWPLATAAAALLGLVATAAIVARSLSGRERLPGVARLALAQGSLFTAIEVAERLAAGRSPVSLLEHNLWLVGLLVQPLVALLVTAVIRLLCRVAAALAESRSKFSATCAIRLPGRWIASPRPQTLAGACGLRGPPA